MFEEMGHFSRNTKMRKVPIEMLEMKIQYHE